MKSIREERNPPSFWAKAISESLGRAVAALKSTRPSGSGDLARNRNVTVTQERNADIGRPFTAVLAFDDLTALGVGWHAYYDCPMPVRHPSLSPLVAMCILLSFVTPGQAQVATSHSTLDQFRPQFESALKQHGVVGGGFALVNGHGPAQTLAFGEARADSHRRIDDATAYNWASITKTMTAIAILQLRDRGKLSLDDSAVRYVPELRQVHDAFGSIDVITIRQLLTHSAGFRNPNMAVGLR